MKRNKINKAPVKYARLPRHIKSVNDLLADQEVQEVITHLTTGKASIRKIFAVVVTDTDDIIHFQAGFDTFHEQVAILELAKFDILNNEMTDDTEEQDA